MKSPEIRAIVFDTNTTGHGEPNLEVVERWADACGDHSAELWLPEVVVWEWAQHVHESVNQHRAATESHSRRRQAWGQRPLPTPPGVDLDDIVDALEAAGGVIIELPDTVAREAIRDQILLTGPGERRKGTKTGAADSAWMRSIIAHNGGTAEGLIVVTGDRSAVTETCAALQIGEPMVAAHLGEIQDRLGEAVDADASQEEVFNSTITQLTDDDLLSTSGLYDLADLGDSNWWRPHYPRSWGLNEWEGQMTGFSISGAVRVIGIVRHDPWSKSLTGRIQVPVSIYEEYARQDQRGDAPEYQRIECEGWIQGDLVIFPRPDGTWAPVSNELLEVELLTDEGW